MKFLLQFALGARRFAVAPRWNRWAAAAAAAMVWLGLASAGHAALLLYSRSPTRPGPMRTGLRAWTPHQMPPTSPPGLRGLEDPRNLYTNGGEWAIVAAGSAVSGNARWSAVALHGELSRATVGDR